MRHLIVALVMAPLLALGGRQQAQAGACRTAITPRTPIHRGLPQTYYDQGRSSIFAIYPRHRLLAHRRDGVIGKVSYALLAFQPTPTDSVSLHAVAVDWSARVAWDLDAKCTIDDWSVGLIAMMEALAALPKH